MVKRGAKQLGKDVDFCINEYHLNGTRSTGKLTGIHKQNVLAYFADKRNNSVISNSVQVAGRLSNYGINYKFRVDQIRDESNIARLYDIKYSRMDCVSLVQMYLPQLIICSEGLGVEVGGLINVRNYGNDRPVFIRIEVDYASRYAKTLSELLMIERLKSNVSND